MVVYMLRAKQVDGLIIIPTIENLDLYISLKKNNFPLVFLDRIISPVLYPTILLDNHLAVKLAIQKLLVNNHQKIGFISSTMIENFTPRVERLEAYKICLTEAGITPSEDWMIHGSEQEIYQQLQRLYDNNNFPTAFFTSNDLSLQTLLKFTKHHNISIPANLSVTSIDDSPYLDLFTPSITVVKQPTFEMGMTAAKYLLSSISSADYKEEYEIKRFAPALIDRESVRNEE